MLKEKEIKEKIEELKKEKKELGRDRRWTNTAGADKNSGMGFRNRTHSIREYKKVNCFW